MACVEGELLEAFARGELAPDGVDALDAHLDACERCRAALVSVVRSASVKRWQPPQGAPASPDPNVGRVVAERYRLLARLGTGGMGAVYEAEHVLVGRRVAVKLLHRDLAQNRDVVRRFHNEARAAAVIGHPGIVDALDMGTTEDGAPFLVLELLRGHDLAKELARVRMLPVARAVRIAAQVASALAAAHERGIVHRDVKPENVFLLEDDRVKVLDFGVSKAIGSRFSAAQTQRGALLGTPYYMAPEQFDAANEVDGRADVYALGALLHHAIAGAVPHDAESLPALLLRVKSTPVTPLDALRPGVPRALADVVSRALAADPAGRFASMHAMADALAPFTSLAPDLAPRVSRARASRRLVTLLYGHRARDLDATIARLRAVGMHPEQTADGTFLVVFGEKTWRGDELSRALAAATLCLETGARAVVTTGYVARTGETVTGDPLDAARAIADASDGLPALLVTEHAARGASREHGLERVAPKLFTHVPGVAERVAGSFDDETARPLLGREADVLAIRTALATVCTQRQPLVMIAAGPPGIGKTRLAAELTRQLEHTRIPFELLVARSESDAQDRSYALLASLLRSALVRFPGDGHARLDAFLASLAKSDVSLAPHALTLAEWLELAPRTQRPTHAPVASATRKDRLTVALHAVFSALCASPRPLALVLDDVDFADRPSLTLLEAVLDEAASRPWLVFATTRTLASETRPALLRGRATIELHLRGLERDDVATLVSWYAGHELAEPWTDRVFERTGGVPLFVERVAQWLAQHATKGSAVEALELPPTLEAAAQASLDVLPDAELELCKIIAILGAPCTEDELVAMGVSHPADPLLGLQRRDVLRRTQRDDGERTVWFRAALVAEVAARMLDETRSRALHRRAAEVWARREPVDYESVARHHELGSDSAAAARVYAQATESAVRRGDAAAILRCSGRALELGLPSDEVLRVRLARADAWSSTGAHGDAGRELEAALLSARDERDRAFVLVELGMWSLRTARSDARETFASAAAAAERAGESTSLARAWAGRALTALYGGDATEAEQWLVRAERLVTAHAPELLASLCVWRAQLAGVRGDHGERRDAYWAAIELYRRADDPRNVAGAQVNVADAYNRLGAYAEAERALLEGIATCRRLSLDVWARYGTANLAYARLASGLIAQALETIDECLAMPGGDERVRLGAQLYRAKIALAATEHEDAADEAATVAHDARALAMPGVAAIALAVAARANLGLGRCDRAMRQATEALALRDELGGVEEDEAEVFLAAADAARAAGDDARCAQILARGRARTLEIASRIRDAGWRESFLTHVPANCAILERTGNAP